LKKILVLGVLLAVLLMFGAVSVVTAKVSNGTPFNDIWDSMNDLVVRTDGLEERIERLEEESDPEPQHEFFLKMTNIPGESQDQTHKDEIDVLAWSWGMSQSGSFHVGGGGGAGKVDVQDMSITKYIDKSSTDLMLHVANGAHIPEAVLTVRKAGGDPVDYLVIEMKKVLVTSVSTGGSGGEDRLTENLSLNFAEVKVTYTEQKSDGTGVEHSFHWDIANNQEL
jgi:type VI secretion system secreted protein Hcp